MMLARVADSLYWIGRYVERAEHLSRVSDVMLTATLDNSEASATVSRIAVAAMEDLDPTTAEAMPPIEVVRKLLFDRENLGSIFNSLARARENARQVRDQITTEIWERLNLLYLRLTDPSAEPAFTQAPSSFLHGIIADLHLFKGATDATMSHGQGWRFLLLGVHLERAQRIAHLLDVCFGDSAAPDATEHLAQMAVLRMACALEPYLRVYTAEINPLFVLQFLLFDEEFPRSIRFSSSRIEDYLNHLAPAGAGRGQGGPERLAGRLKARLEFADLDETLGAGAILSGVVAECSRIHLAVYETFIDYPLEQRLRA